jgi:type IV secretory pathway TrbF-like protein
MRSKGGRTIKLSPVDEDSHVTDHPSRAGLEALMDQKLFHQRIKSERSAAYWFAASMWGVGGLVIGAVLGGYMVYQAYVGLTPSVRDTLVQGQVIHEATQSVNSHQPLLSEPQTPPQQP